MIDHIQGELLARVAEAGQEREAQARLARAMEGLTLTCLPSAMEGLVVSGQALQPHQLRCLDSLQHMEGDQEHLEAPANPASQQYLAQRCKEEERQEPAFLPSMASHCVQTPPQHQLYQQL